jgi:deoxyribodipyrimidine photo-lyase
MLLNNGGHTAILWLRRDLRVHDHPALEAARSGADALVPVFCFDDRLLHGRHASGARTQFLLECLADLDASLRQRASRLVVRRGRPERELPALARECGARAVHFSADVGPFARARDDRVKRALSIPVHDHPGTFVVDDLDEIRTTTGKPYTVFTPFYRKWTTLPRREQHGAPRRLPPLPKGLPTGPLPSLADLGLRQEIEDPRCRGGETNGRTAMRDGSAPLSPYLHFGCTSAREAEDQAADNEVRRQLCWRDFFAHVLLHHPQNARSEHQSALPRHDSVEARAQTL